MSIVVIFMMEAPLAPQFVRPYVKSKKNDAADAQAICEAVSRPSMRFVAIKTVEQQTVLSMHRAREGFIKTRTATANQVRGLLAGFGRSRRSVRSPPAPWLRPLEIRPSSKMVDSWQVGWEARGRCEVPVSKSH